MNAAETIAAAIEKLERERAASNPAGETWRVADSITREFATIRSTSAWNDSIVATELMREDAELIVTLHRTIGAQLAILRSFEDHLTNPAWDHDDDEESAPAVLDVVALARAILGEATN